MKHHIVYYGHEALRQEAEKIETINNSLKEITDEMFKLMIKHNGIGLAGPQIALNQRLVTIDLSSYDQAKYVLINPEIVWSSKKLVPYQEGCLSIPGIFEDVMRPDEVVVQALDLSGKEIEIKGDDILARVLQHELDHLNGVMFVDHLEEFLRKEYTKELKKIKKMNR